MTGKILTVIALLLIAVLVAGASGLQAATLAVPGTHSTIAAAFAAAQVGDRIELAPGLYQENQLALPRGVTVVGTGDGPAEVIIDGQGSGRILLAEQLDRLSLITNLTFRNGHAAGNTSSDRSGGAIFCSNSHLRIINCIFADNVSEGQGGAIRCNNSSPLITGCIFRNNVANNGGGGAIDCSINSSPIIRGTEFHDNSAAWGGALSCRGLSSPQVSDVLFKANHAVGTKAYGGAVFADYGSAPLFTQSTYVDNTARYGGALACLSDSETNLENCTLVGNSAEILGGGLFSYNAEPHITASIISFQEGTGISVEGDLVPMITCSDIFGNSQGDWVGNIATQLAETDNLAVDPLFCDSATRGSENLVLAAGSPCGAADLACGTIGAWPMGCDGVATLISTLNAQWQSQDAQLSWQSHTDEGDAPPEFRLIGYRNDAPEFAWEVPIHDLGDGYYSALDPNSRDSAGSTFTYRLFVAVAIPNDPWAFVGEISLVSTPGFPGIRDLESWPNPFNPMTTISFRLGKAQRTRISVYSPDGRRIVVLADRQLEAGMNRQTWNGRDSQGNGVGAGTYIVLVEGAVERKTQKITLLK